MLHVACCLWDVNSKSESFSRCYDHTWVDKLYRGFKRNLTVPFEFILFTDRGRPVSAGIQQRRLASDSPDYGCLIEPFALDRPTIICGLDTIVLSNVDHFADYCERATVMACPRDPYQPDRLINAIVLAPAGHSHVYKRWTGQNDMDWLRRFPWQPIDDLFPSEVVSLKFHLGAQKVPPYEVKKQPTDKTKVVYFHGVPKPHQLGHVPWVQEHWR